jgi:endonuclease/exonuclease/phosphatase family metal-dependent hydrolase
MSRTALFTVLFLTFGCSIRTVESPPAEPVKTRGELVVMTFNIRYGTAEDGPNAWSYRKDLVAGLIHEKAPDALALQEALDFQLDDLAEVLAGYRKLGQHRNGGTRGEFSGLYLNTRRLRVLRWGELWLSAHPDSVASVGWDAALPRMAVWADVEPRQGGPPIRIYGTHFDHRGDAARLESARLIASHARGGPPAVVMGDLNAGEDSPPLHVFFDLGFRSAFSTLHPGNELGTFNGFQDPSGGDRIDHILLDPRVQPVEAEILDSRVDGAWPSDHFPVVAVLRSAWPTPVTP